MNAIFMEDTHLKDKNDLKGHKGATHLASFFLAHASTDFDKNFVKY